MSGHGLYETRDAPFGGDFMNLAGDAAVAQAGVAQGRNEAEALREICN